MKIEYSKPWIVMETFELAEHIASCTVSGYANHTSITMCGFDMGDPNGTYFLDTNPSKCGYNPDPEFYSGDETEIDGGSCYYSNFSDFDVLNMFSS